jgi:glycosyltransferase involved in cell wall biosynthesis
LIQEKIANIAAIIPVKGRPALLKEALDSILSGNILPSSVFVVIDSIGEEREMDSIALEEFFLRSKKIFSEIHFKKIYSANEGPARARNLAAKEAKEEWISFLDSDDLWLPEKLESQISYLKKRPHLHGASGLERWIKNGKVLIQPQKLRPGHGRFIKDSLHRCLVPCSSVIIRRSIFLDEGGFDENFPVCEDYEFWIRFLSRHPLGFIDREIAIKRSGDWSQLSSSHSLDKYRILALLKSVQNCNFSKEESGEAKKACYEKFSIFESGAKKRGNHNEAEDLIMKINSVFG